MNADRRWLAAEGLPSDDTFGLLPNRRRGRLVSALACREPAVSLETLAGAVASRESANPTDEQVYETAIALHHVQLPRLAEADVVEYDPETRTVTDVRRDRIRTLLSDED